MSSLEQGRLGGNADGRQAYRCRDGCLVFWPSIDRVSTIVIQVDDLVDKSSQHTRTKFPRHHGHWLVRSVSYVYRKVGETADTFQMGHWIRMYFAGL